MLRLSKFGLLLDCVIDVSITPKRHVTLYSRTCCRALPQTAEVSLSRTNRVSRRYQFFQGAQAVHPLRTHLYNVRKKLSTIAPSKLVVRARLELARGEYPSDASETSMSTLLPSPDHVVPFTEKCPTPDSNRDCLSASRDSGERIYLCSSSRALLGRH